MQDVVKELNTLNKKEYFFFVDDNIAGNPKFAKELFRAIKPYKIRWIGQATVNIAKDDELLELAAASGCFALLIGFESLSPANLAAIGKNINVVDEYQNLIAKIHSKGINIHGFFIIGLDEDDGSVFKRTVRFAQKMRLESAGFAVPVPLPGTELTRSLEKEGRIIHTEWSRYVDEIVFEPKLMSRQDLINGHNWALREFFKPASILKRIGLAHRDLMLLWLVNLQWWAHYRRLGLR